MKATVATTLLVGLATQQAAASSCAAVGRRGPSCGLSSGSSFLPSHKVQQQRFVQHLSPFEHATRAFNEFASAAAAASPAVTQPSYDVAQTPTGYTLTLELPGCGLKDVQVEVEEGGEVLKIEGRRPAIGARRAATLRSRFEIKDIDTSSIKATMSNGVLTLQLQKAPKPGAVQIPITFEEPRAAAATEPTAPEHAQSRNAADAAAAYKAAADFFQQEQQQQQEGEELIIADDYEQLQQQECQELEPSPTAFEDTPVGFA